MLLIDPNEPLALQNEKLVEIATSLMKRVEQEKENSGVAYVQFERAAMLEAKVRERTQELERTLDLLQDSNAQLEAANDQAEDARANLSDAIESISEGFALFDADDRLVLFNSRFCKELPDVTEQLKSSISFETYVKAISASKYLDLPMDLSPEKWQAKRLTRHSEDHVIFNVGLKSDLWLQISEHRTARGGTVILQTDVTTLLRMERKEREKMRDHQAQILQATLDHLNQGVCIFDNNKNLVGWNSKMEVLLALPPESSALGSSFEILFDKLDYQLVFDTPEDASRLNIWASEERARQPISMEVNTRQGQTLSVFGQEMPDRGFVISLTDVSAERSSARALAEANELLEHRVEERTRELGEALSEAERANASKARFFAAASHDLLQPLSAAKLFVSSLSEQVEQPHLHKVIEKAETSLSSVEQIIEALLDISKLDSNKPVFNVQSVQLSKILDPLADELSPVARAKGLDLRIVKSGLTLRSDPAYLRRIVQNLISNAIRYTDQGKVLVGARRDGDTAWIEIWDTGRGIAKEHQESIFREFQRVHVKDVEVGLGLGLAIVERACQGLSHALTLESEPGKGSRFRFQVPVNKFAVTTSTGEHPKRTRTGLKRNNLIVFLVENEEQLANAMVMMIESWGAHVIHAPSGEEALALLQELDLQPDFFLLDYQLGSGMSGTELAQELLEQFPGVSTQLISANRGPDLQLECNRLGISHMHKPIDKFKLLDFLNA